MVKYNRYITDPELAGMIYLSYHLNKPIFLEGEPGVGKTEVAIVLSQILETQLIRLQCYEGLDANTALYEWNYPKQLLRIKMDEQSDKTPDEIGGVIYSEPYLIKRPLLEAILSSQEDNPVLLIDELGDGDEEFEAFLLVHDLLQYLMCNPVQTNLGRASAHAPAPDISVIALNLIIRGIPVSAM